MVIFPRLLSSLTCITSKICIVGCSPVMCLLGSQDVSSSGQPPPSLFLSQRQNTDLNVSLYFRYHRSPYQPNPPEYGLFSSHHRLRVAPEKATEVLGCSFSLLAPTSASATQAAERENLPSLDCSAADSSD